ncbi:hypothetical protein JCM15519_07440 [Fundidesulfovibrio butyratiphilus]
MININTTMGQALAICRKLGAGQASMIGREKDGTLRFGIFIVDEPELTARIERTCAEWDREQDEKAEGA